MITLGRWVRMLVAVIVVAVMVTVALSSCGSTKDSGRGISLPKANHNSTLYTHHSTFSEEDSLRYSYFFLEAVRQQNAGHYDAAYDLLRHALRIHPQAAEAWFLLSMYEGELNNDSVAVAYMERAASLRPDNTTYLERLAQYYIGSKQYARATEAYERLATANHQRTDVLNILTQLYMQDRNYDGMLRSISRVEDVEGNTEELTLSKMRVYELKGDKKSAWRTLKSLSDEHPSDVNYRVMMGNWLLQNNREKEAGRIFTAALKEDPDNAYAQSSLYDYYRAQGEDSLARQMMLNIIASPKSSTESKSTMMRQAIMENEHASGDSTEILRLFDRILENCPADSDMAEMKVAYMTLKKMPEDSVNNALRQLLVIAPENVGARLQLLGSSLRREDWDGVVSICFDGSQYNPDEMVFYYYEGLAYYQQKRSEEALGAFRRGVAQVNGNSNKELVADLYYFMGDLLHQKDLDKEAFEAYDSCLQWKDDHTSCLNNYAYYLCLKGENLEKAEQMSYKTIKANPSDPNQLDTYAWILFTEERFAEAKIYIDQALKFTLEEQKTDSVAVDSVSADTTEADNEGQSAVLLEHAGDIYVMNGDVAKAVELWRRAIEVGTDREPLIARKINEQRYIKDDK